MRVTNIRKEYRDQAAILKADIKDIRNPGLNKNWSGPIWFSVPKEYATYLTDERYDGFLVALLYPAMAYGEDIEIDGPVSEKLLYNITQYVVHILLAYSPWLQKINISTKETTDKAINATHVGAGFSGGVDSFTTIYDRFACETNQKYKIDTLLNLNVGNYYGNDPENTDALFQRAYSRLSGFPNSVGLPYIPVNSSLAYVYNEKWNFQKVHLLNTLSGVLTLQNHFHRYYFGSALSYKEIPDAVRLGRDFDIAAFCDVYICQFLSTETLSFIPDGHQYTRFQKTERISHYPPTYEFLEVAPPDSVGKQPVTRPKSIRILTSLDTLGRLDLYSKIFDLEEYKRRRFFIRCQVVVDHKKKNPFAIDNVEFARLYKKKLPSPLLAFSVCKSIAAYDRIRRAIRRRLRRK